MLDCRQVLAELSNYIDDDVTHELRSAIEQHIKRCGRCRAVLDTTRRTLVIVSESLPERVPLPISERLHARLNELYTGR